MVETGKKWKKLLGKNLVKTLWVFTVWSLLANPDYCHFIFKVSM